MRNLGDFFAPLKWWIFGMFGLLIFWLFSGSVSTSTTQMASNVTAAHPDVGTKIYAWSWMSNPAVVLMLIFFAFMGIMLFNIGKEWLRSRYTR